MRKPTHPSAERDCASRAKLRYSRFIMAISKRTGQRAKAGRIGDVRVVKNLMSMRDARDWSKMEAADHWYHLRVQFESGRESDLLFTSHEIARALKRAQRNPEDVPKVSRLRDALD